MVLVVSKESEKLNINKVCLSIMQSKMKGKNKFIS